MLIEPEVHADLLNDIDMLMEREPNASLSVVVAALTPKYEGADGEAAIRQVFDECLLARAIG